MSVFMEKLVLGHSINARNLDLYFLLRGRLKQIFSDDTISSSNGSCPVDIVSVRQHFASRDINAMVY